MLARCQMVQAPPVASMFSRHVSNVLLVVVVELERDAVVVDAPNNISEGMLDNLELTDILHAGNGLV